MKFLRQWFSRMNRPFEPRLRRRFPIGQPYRSLVAAGRENGRPWVEYKLQSAQWYLDVLAELHARRGDFDRLIGEEMALDGYLTAASSAFDAATGGLVVAIEIHRAIPEAARTPSHQWRWERAKQLADNADPSIALNCQTEVDEALEGDHSATPTGWLAQFRRLRNRVAHQDSLTRAFYRNVGGPDPDPPSRLNVPGCEPVEPMPYLVNILPTMRRMCETIMTDSDKLNP